MGGFCHMKGSLSAWMGTRMGDLIFDCLARHLLLKVEPWRTPRCHGGATAGEARCG